MSERCKYCESVLCDGDCYSCAQMYNLERPTAAELRAAGPRPPDPAKLWLVVVKDKELAGEPDVGVGIIEGDTSDAHSAGAKMLEALAERGRGRCVARSVEIERGRFYRATMWFRTAPTAE